MKTTNQRVTSMNDTRRLVQMSIFTALIFILAFTPGIGYIPLGFTNVTTIHIPVIIGSILLGPKSGAILGGMFGLTSFLKNTTTPTITSFVFTPFYSLGDYSGGIGSLITCFVPRILIGVVPYFVYQLVKKCSKSQGTSNVGLVLAGIAGSMTNTCLVMACIFFFFKDSYAAANGTASEAVVPLILGIVGTNGVPEAIVAAVITLFVGKALMRGSMRERFNLR